MITSTPRLALTPFLLALIAAFLQPQEATREAKASSDDQASTRVTPFLLFQDGNAEEAMEFYTGLFDDGRIVSVERYGPEGPGPEGTIYYATFEVAGQAVRCHDSPIRHEFDFTPAISLFVDCSSEEQLERLAEALGEDGKVYMPIGDYGFSQKFTWVADRYGVSWQLNLP